MPEPAIPQEVDEITADWVNEVFKQSGLAADPRVSVVENSVIGDEKGFLSQVVRASLSYEGSPGKLPGTIIVKIEPMREAWRAAERRRSSFEREISFYQEIAPNLSVNVPRVFHTAMTPEAKVLVMEDLGHLTACDQIRGMEHERVLATARGIAQVHAAFWDNEALAGLTWLPDHEHFHDEGIEEDWAAFAEAYGLRIGKEGLRLGAWVAENMAWWRQEIRARPSTLIHGDLRADNLFFGAPGTPQEVMFIDWQGAKRGLAAIDVARLLGGSEPVAERSGRQMEVFEAWHQALCQAGVAGYPAEDALNDFRLAALHCLFIPVKVFQLTGGRPTGRTGRLLDAITQRHYASAIELEAARAIP
jgi:aminoglycoside phosphotransferase (APT) family kinase protein